MEGRVYLEHAQALFRAIKRRGERALAQVSDEQFFAQLDGESNSLAVLVKHVAGNARSRWTDFLTTDGEKSDRHRDEEFVVRPGDTRERLLERWEAGWGALFETLAALAPEHLAQEVLIRREPHSVFEALERQKEHYAYHVGQMVFLAKHLARSGWQSLSVMATKLGVGPFGGRDLLAEGPMDGLCKPCPSNRRAGPAAEGR